MTGAWRSGARRWWWLLVVGVLIGAVGGWAAANRVASAPSVSTAQIVVTGRLSDNRVDSALTSNQYVNQRMSTYVLLAVGESTRRVAADGLGMAEPLPAGAVTAENPIDTTVLVVSVQASRSEEAKLGADAMASAVTTEIERIENPAGQAGRVQLSVISPPTLPAPPPQFPLWVTIGLGLLGGLFLGVAAIGGLVARERSAETRRRRFQPLLGEPHDRPAFSPDRGSVRRLPPQRPVAAPPSPVPPSGTSLPHPSPQPSPQPSSSSATPSSSTVQGASAPNPWATPGPTPPADGTIPVRRSLVGSAKITDGQSDA